MSEYLTEITFPSFGISLNASRGFFIGNFQIYWYAVLIASGLLLAVIYACRRCKTFGLRDNDLIDGVLCIVPFAVVCARAYYCVFRWEAFSDNPISVLNIREGGLAIYGGVIGAVIGIVIFALVKKNKVRLTAVLDITALGFLIGQSVGRWGNFINREAFGAETDSFLRMGLLNSLTGKVTCYHPTFLYESLWNACGFVLLHFLSKKRKYDGQIALGYVAWYGLGRALIEGLRTDSLYLGQFRVSQLLAATSCIIAVVVLIVMAFKQHDPEKLFVNVVAKRNAPTEPVEAEQITEVTEEQISDSE
jgi:phosphatidylglycerol:prolipoprotein diacylglycerol transferase